MNYKYNELDYAKLIYAEGFQTKHIPTELRLVAIYMKTMLEYKPKKLREEIYKFCAAHIPEYSRVKYYKVINRTINQASKKNTCLIKIDSIVVYDFEIDYINTYPICYSDGTIPNFAYDCKKLMFTLLCQMKLNSIILEKKSGNKSSGLYFKGGNRKYNDLKSKAKLQQKLNISSDVIYVLSQCNAIMPMFNGLIKLNFMEKINELKETVDNPNVVITIENFETIGWYFDYYNNIGNMKLCKECNQPFKQTKSDILYCSEHKQYYQPIGTKTIKCIEPDCSKEFEVDAWDMKTCRCKDCQDKRDKELNKIASRERMKKYRENKKIE